MEESQIYGVPIHLDPKRIPLRGEPCDLFKNLPKTDWPGIVASQHEYHLDTVFHGGEAFDRPAASEREQTEVMKLIEMGLHIRSQRLTEGTVVQPAEDVLQALFEPGVPSHRCLAIFHLEQDWK